MKKTYWYALENSENFTYTNLEEAIDEYTEVACDKQETIILIESKPSRKSNAKWCEMYNELIDSDDSCGKENCDDYNPRNLKGGICSHNVYTLMPTGRKWKINPDGTVKKISGRKK